MPVALELLSAHGRRPLHLIFNDMTTVSFAVFAKPPVQDVQRSPDCLAGSQKIVQGRGPFEDAIGHLILLGVLLRGELIRITLETLRPP